MNTSQKLVLLALVVLLSAALAGYLLTSGGAGLPLAPKGVKQKNVHSASPVDLSPLRTAQRLALLATRPEEQNLAHDALRVADHEVDLAFAVALREAAEQPPPSDPEIREILGRLQNSQKPLAQDQARVAQLTKQAAAATGRQKDELDDELQLAKAELELDKDEVDDAKEDLLRAGGDPQGQIQRLVEEHEAGSHDGSTGIGSSAANATSTFSGGLIGRFQEWSGLRSKQKQVSQAQQDAQASQPRLKAEHEELEKHLEAEKAKAPQLRHVARASSNSALKVAVTRSKEESAALLESAKHLSADQKELAQLDKRIRDEEELADVYGRWAALVAQEQRAALHKLLREVFLILLIALAVFIGDRWMQAYFEKLAPDRRRLLTMRTVTRLAVQVAGVLLVFLVLFGPPSQLGTFLGLAGAGLTVALKDFIVGFIGWFVLMGKNGIRLGDWVEINGVSGEVVEIGLFRTVLLETGNWTDAGHPTGRRVTFTNSFAIEGHYFNFSTSGQWLWDELQVVLPAGADPYPIVDAIQKKVTEATAQNAQLAEQEWRRGTRSREMSAFTALPAINIRPVIGGIEIAVRYITRANERHQLRSKLYQSIVDLLGRKGQPISVPSAAGSN